MRSVQLHWFGRRGIASVERCLRLNAIRSTALFWLTIILSFRKISQSQRDESDDRQEFCYLARWLRLDENNLMVFLWSKTNLSYRTMSQSQRDEFDDPRFIVEHSLVRSDGSDSKRTIEWFLFGQREFSILDRLVWLHETNSTVPVRSTRMLSSRTISQTPHHQSKWLHSIEDNSLLLSDDSDSTILIQMTTFTWRRISFRKRWIRFNDNNATGLFSLERNFPSRTMSQSQRDEFGGSRSIDDNSLVSNDDSDSARLTQLTTSGWTDLSFTERWQSQRHQSKWVLLIGGNYLFSNDESESTRRIKRFPYDRRECSRLDRSARLHMINSNGYVYLKTNLLCQTINHSQRDELDDPRFIAEYSLVRNDDSNSMRSIQLHWCGRTRIFRVERWAKVNENNATGFFSLRTHLPSRMMSHSQRGRFKGSRSID